MRIPTSAVLLLMLCSITAAQPIANTTSPDPTLTADFFVHLYKEIRQNASTISFQIGQFDIPPTLEQLVQLEQMGIECQRLIDFFNRTTQTRKLTSLSLGGRMRCFFSEVWCGGQLAQTKKAINDALKGFQNVNGSHQISGQSQEIMVNSPSTLGAKSVVSPPPSSPSLSSASLASSSPLKMSTSRSLPQPPSPPPSQPISSPSNSTASISSLAPASSAINPSAAFISCTSLYHNCSIQVQAVNSILQAQDQLLLPSLSVLATQASGLTKIDSQVSSIATSCKQSLLSSSQSTQLDTMATYLHSQISSQEAQITILRQKAGMAH